MVSELKDDPIRWGENKKTKKLNNILDVENGKKCGCICPKCKAPLVAHNMGFERTKHFKHEATKGCKGGAETAIHLKAKEIIETKKKIKIPSLNVIERNGEISKTVCVSQVELLALDNNIIKEEKNGTIVPDLFVSYKERELLIEIAVTHFVDKEKLEKIKLQGVSCIEVDLSDLYKSKKDITDETLENHVIYKVSNKQWIFNKKLQQAKNVAKSEVDIEILNQRKTAEEEKGRYYLSVKKSLQYSLENNPKLSFDFEFSEYLDNFSNRVFLELHGKIESTFNVLKFVANIELESGTNFVDFHDLIVNEVPIKLEYFENLIMLKLNALAKNDIYNWLPANVRKIARNKSF